MTDRRPGTGPYARPEREQRWLLPAVPGDAHHPVDIDDRYFPGTLRLRMVDDGDRVVHKLTQKVREGPTDPSRNRLTTMYLSAEEHELLTRLGGSRLAKRRWRWAVAGRQLVVDEHLGLRQGIVLAEVELGPEDAPAEAPPGALAEVTGDERFTGAALAGMAPGEAALLVAGVLDGSAFEPPHQR
jgi:CYTH domain-containing protein